MGGAEAAHHPNEGDPLSRRYQFPRFLLGGGLPQQLGVHYWLDAPSYEYYLFASYHISGNTARNRIAPLEGHHLLAHGLRVDFGCAF